MLTIFRSNRAEFLVDVLASQLQSDPPDPFEPVRVVVNTWPTSRWLGEQLATRLGGIAAHVLFPFPAAHLAAIVDACLEPDAEMGPDPWRATRLVWPLLELLPEIADQPEGEPLRRWLGQQTSGTGLASATWQMGRAIADAFDDYALYRPGMLAAWEAGQPLDGGESPLPASQLWQPALYRALRQRLNRAPFALRVAEVIERLRRGDPLPAPLLERQGSHLRLFGLSSLAPLQVTLLQALSAHLAVDLYLLTPCRDLWMRCQDRRRELRDALLLHQPLEGEWLSRAPGLEARFGRLGAEFQQLLEGTGEAQLGEVFEGDLFFTPASVSAQASTAPPPLLHQLQQQLVEPGLWPDLLAGEQDHSLEFHLCPGTLRQVQIVRDRLLQLLAEHDDLQPRDILVMTPQVERFAPLVASVFGDAEATGVALPWRLTDRSQQAQGQGLARCLLRLLPLAGERLSASALESVLDCRPLQQRFGLELAEIQRLHRELQRLGFRWGLDGEDRDGDPTHSLSWAIDRLLLSLALAPAPGLALGDDAAVAPAQGPLPLDLVGRWLHLLQRLRHWLRQLRRSRSAGAWADLLRQLVTDLFADGGDGAAELPGLLAAIEDGLAAAADSCLELTTPVLAAVLEEALAVDAGRFGHRSGALTISALEPMRAIPHRVIVLMGLDADSYPRRNVRPGFHLIGQRRLLGDADPADQDRYILLEALLSARDRLVITWNCRDDRTGEDLPPAAPVRHWLDWLASQLPDAAQSLQLRHPASSLEVANFLPRGGRSPASCDRRLLQTRLRLDLGSAPAPAGLALLREPGDAPASGPAEAAGAMASLQERCEDLRAWLMHPQRHWLAGLGLRAREWHERCEDLEALELDERGRASLLRQVYQDSQTTAAQALPPRQAEDWLLRQRGTGQLPGLSAGELEARELQQRWSSLEACLAGLGDPWSRDARWGALAAELTGRGNHVLRVHCGRESISHVLALWLDLLLACAAASPAARQPDRGVLISRSKEDQFAITTTLLAPDSPTAAAELERLIALQDQWRQRCWPVPPRSGWAWLEAEQRRPGSGAAQAAQVWEGSLHPGERQEEEMVVCFGADLPSHSLLAEPFAACAIDLLQPLLAARQPAATRRRR